MGVLEVWNRDGEAEGGTATLPGTSVVFTDALL